MKATEVRELVENLGGYEHWRNALGDANEAKSQHPPADHNSPEYLRAQAAMLDAQAAITPATEKLKLDVVEAKDLMGLPFRLGLLRALDRNLTAIKRPKDYRVQTFDMHFRGRSHDLDIQDYAFSSSDPFQHAVGLGNAIVEVEEALPRRKKSVFAAVLRIGDNGRRSIVYRQPTVAKFYNVIVPKDRQLCSEPTVESDHVEYALPKLPVSDTEAIVIPKIEMLESSNKRIEPVKLLLGKEAVEFAKKYKTDVEDDRKATRARTESYDRLMRMRIN